MPYITEAQLPQLLRRFENIRFSDDGNGQREYIDIAAAWHEDDADGRCHYPDCDIRALTGAGVERQWDGGAEVIRFNLIRTVTIGCYERGSDGWLEYRPREIYRVISKRQPERVAA
ncbi:hypothetical protein [Synechococcus phage Yong-M3-232]|nr:hypothetical protein [Synechococcus phage Yong-M3-232]